MAFSRKALAALTLAAVGAKVEAAFGSAFSTGPTATDTYIVESWATLTLPAVPSDNDGDLSLWVGMGTSNGDLIQSIAENYGTSDWSLYAYTLIETSDTSQYADQAAGSTGDAGTAVTFHYKYDDSTGNYTQNVIVGGSVISTLTTSDGYAEGWGSAVECADTSCGTVAAHTWSNVSIILNAADADYIDTLALGDGVEATMTTADSGITWEVGTIKIPGYDFSSLAVVDSTDTSSTAAATTAASTAAAVATPVASSSPYGSSSSGSDSAAGTQASGSASSSPYGSSSGSDSASGAQASGSPSTTGGENSGSSTWGSSGSQASGGSWGGFGGSGSSSWGSSGAQQSQGASSSYGSGSSSWGSSGAQESQGASSSYGSGSSSWGSSGAQESQGASASYGGSAKSNAAHGWQRSRIARN